MLLLSVRETNRMLQRHIYFSDNGTTKLISTNYLQYVNIFLILQSNFITVNNFNCETIIFTHNLNDCTQQHNLQDIHCK